MAYRLPVAAFLFVLAFAQADAKVVKNAMFFGYHLHFCVHPDLGTPSGWVQDDRATNDLGILVLVPKGQTFTSAPAVVYGRAIHDPKKSKHPSLQSRIDADIRDFRARDPKARVKEVARTPILGGSVRTFEFELSGASEIVCHHREAEYWTLFVLTGKTAKDRAAATPAFRKVMARYR